MAMTYRKKPAAALEPPPVKVLPRDIGSFMSREQALLIMHPGAVGSPRCISIDTSPRGIVVRCGCSTRVGLHVAFI